MIWTMFVNKKKTKQKLNFDFLFEKNHLKQNNHVENQNTSVYINNTGEVYALKVII